MEDDGELEQLRQFKRDALYLLNYIAQIQDNLDIRHTCEDFVKKHTGE